MYKKITLLVLTSTLSYFSSQAMMSARPLLAERSKTAPPLILHNASGQTVEAQIVFAHHALQGRVDIKQTPRRLEDDEQITIQPTQCFGTDFGYHWTVDSLEELARISIHAHEEAGGLPALLALVGIHLSKTELEYPCRSGQTRFEIITNKAGQLVIRPAHAKQE